MKGRAICPTLACTHAVVGKYEHLQALSLRFYFSLGRGEPEPGNEAKHLAYQILDSSKIFIK